MSFQQLRVCSVRTGIRDSGFQVRTLEAFISKRSLCPALVALSAPPGLPSPEVKSHAATPPSLRLLQTVAVLPHAHGDCPECRKDRGGADPRDVVSLEPTVVPRPQGLHVDRTCFLSFRTGLSAVPCR